jgi:hypothetical protein
VRLQNQTPFPAHLLRVDLPDEDFVRAVVLSKATYELTQAGVLVPSTAPMPILPEPLATPFGTFHGEIYPKKDQVDLCVLGTLERSVPVTALEVSVRAGDHVRRVRVMGDRRWVRGAYGLVPSRPEPFTAMPLGYSRAYGGRAPSEHGEVAWTDNPDGVGFYLREEDAVDRPLPNLEPSGAPHTSAWSEHVPVAGLGPYPMFWGLRAREGVTLNRERTELTGIVPRLFNHAHPDLVVPSIRPGDTVEIDGARDAPVRFELPRTRAHAICWTAHERVDAPATIDGVFVWLDAARVVVTQRAHFQYVFRKGEPRGALVTMTDASAWPPPGGS